jgi:hypothetical protein
MRHNFSNVHFSTIEVNRHDQSIFVAANVEYHKVANFIS